MKFPEHMNRNDKTIASFVIKQAVVKNDWTISVNDGEAWTVKRSMDPDVISAAMCSTEMDTLKFRKLDGTFIGTMLLVWGNDGECYADSSVDDGGPFDAFCNAVCDRIDRMLLDKRTRR